MLKLHDTYTVLQESFIFTTSLVNTLYCSKYVQLQKNWDHGSTKICRKKLHNVYIQLVLTTITYSNENVEFIGIIMTTFGINDKNDKQ